MIQRVSIVRVYEDPGRRAGEYRILVDRLWPRGRAKGTVDFDEWVRDVSPSRELRTWYAHDVERFPQFSQRYCQELASEPGVSIMSGLRTIGASRRIVLLTATKDVEHSGAEVLRQVMVGRLSATS